MYKDVELMMEIFCDMFFKVLFVECLCSRFVLYLLMFFIGNEDIWVVKFVKSVLGKSVLNIVFVIGFLDMFKVDWMVDDV